jgi:hypothetical protein
MPVLRLKPFFKASDSLQFEQITFVSTKGVTMTTINETMEVLDAVEVMIEQYKSAMADGSINLFDIPKLLPIIVALKDAAQGLSLVPEELKDLDEEEMAELFGKVAGIATMLIDLFKVEQK